MNVWLDDVRQMPEGFDAHVCCAEDAISLLESGDVKFISFDHDLGAEKTGYDVASWIEQAVFEGKLSRVPDWKVHSANPVGSLNILMAMRSAERFVLRAEQSKI